MNLSVKTIGFIAGLFIIFNSSLSAQISESGVPISLQNSTRYLFANQAISEEIVPAFDIEKAKAEDYARGASRFAAPIAVNYSLEENGSWTILPNGDRVWRVQLYAQQAKGLFVYYDDLYLPEGARLFMHSPDGQQIKGAYTHRNNKASGKFLTGSIKGEIAILEYYEPAAVRGQGIIDISRIYFAYENNFEPEIPKGVVKVHAGFGDAAACNVNINCPEGDDWQDHKRGVVRILRVFDEGMGWCSGSLINNTAEDETPYILSAYHCYDGFTPQLDVWRFDFNYETGGCTNPVSEPTYNSMLGCIYRSGWSDTDFLLLELQSNVPSAYNARFNGWNRTLLHLPDTSTIIHHPRGDIKKISQDQEEATIHPNSINWSNGVTTPPNHHYEVNFDFGTHEDGSSGSSLLDENGHIIGQLHGGNSSCFLFQAFFGRFSLSWDEGPTEADRLMEWLDPLQTNQLILDGLEPSTNFITISGNVQTWKNQTMSNVEIIAVGDNQTSYSTFTDINGNYSLDVPEGPFYTLEAHKDTLHDNGVSTFDIVITARDILQIEPFTDPNESLAADVNNNGSVSSFDIVRMRQVILDINDVFPEAESWKFYTAAGPVNTNATVDFTGVKTGDPSGNANPN